MAEGNVLPSIPGEYIARGHARLPRPGPHLGPQATDLDAGVWGGFRITYVAMHNSRAGLGPHQWFWTAEVAERLRLSE